MTKLQLFWRWQYLLGTLFRGIRFLQFHYFLPLTQLGQKTNNHIAQCEHHLSKYQRAESLGHCWNRPVQHRKQHLPQATTEQPSWLSVVAGLTRPWQGSLTFWPYLWCELSCKQEFSMRFLESQLTLYRSSPVSGWLYFSRSDQPGGGTREQIQTTRRCHLLPESRNLKSSLNHISIPLLATVCAFQHLACRVMGFHLHSSSRYRKRYDALTGMHQQKEMPYVSCSAMEK